MGGEALKAADHWQQLQVGKAVKASLKVRGVLAVADAKQLASLDDSHPVAPFNPKP